MLKKDNRSPFSDYSGYVSSLKRLSMESCGIENWTTRVNAALDGQASAELRRVSPVETRRKYGAFFTGTDLSSKLIALGKKFPAKSVFYDPSCGMGDLLVAAARKLPLGKSLADTLRWWGKQLCGTDIHREFIEGARTRVVLLARQRHNSDEALRVKHEDFFPNIRIGNGLEQDDLFKGATHLLLNPPFGQVAVPADCTWSGGRMTEAAQFVIAALERSKPGTKLLAILPDVLRSGSFSEQWRNRVRELAKIRLIEPYGIFDDSADVDVFLLQLDRSGASSRRGITTWSYPATEKSATISHYFNVHVGRVVPHRDPKRGGYHPYIHPRIVPIWGEMTSFVEHRRHLGKTYQPPFVVLRRTSRPGHQYRAAATVILGDKPVAVENHLIVCLPHDKSAATCRELMRQLQSQRVNDFLDNRIRCRHLTVGSVEAIPFEL